MYKRQTEFEKIIIRAKKLYRLSLSSNPNEANVAKAQLAKLKQKYKLKDSMIYPIFEKDIYFVQPGDVINRAKEYLLFTVGKIFGNELKVDVKNGVTFSYKGNQITIDKSLELIEHTENLVKTITQNIYNNFFNMPIGTEEFNSITAFLHTESYKYGVCVGLLTNVDSLIQSTNIVQDKSEKDIIHNMNINPNGYPQKQNEENISTEDSNQIENNEIAGELCHSPSDENTKQNTTEDPINEIFEDMFKDSKPETDVYGIPLNYRDDINHTDFAKGINSVGTLDVMALANVFEVNLQDIRQDELNKEDVI